MNRDDLRADGTAYAVALYAEDADLGQWGMSRCHIVDLQPAPSWTRRAITVRRVGDGKTFTVPPSAVKGRWLDHEAAMFRAAQNAAPRSTDAAGDPSSGSSRSWGIWPWAAPAQPTPRWKAAVRAVLEALVVVVGGPIWVVGMVVVGLLGLLWFIWVPGLIVLAASVGVLDNIVVSVAVALFIFIVGGTYREMRDPPSKHPNRPKGTP